MKGRMAPNNNIGYLLNHLAFVLSRQSDQVLQEQLGIGFSQFKILMVLKWNPSLQQRQIAEWLHKLERTARAQVADVLRVAARDLLVAEDHLARIGTMDAGDQAEKGGLAGPVGTEESENLAAGHRHREPGQGGHPPVALCQLDRVHGGGGGPRGGRRLPFLEVQQGPAT